MSWAIKIDNISKLYPLGEAGALGSNLREDIQFWLSGFAKKLLRRGRNGASTPAAIVDPSLADAPAGHFWALRDVNLEFQQGEVVGIIGRNGAGKSTLLKILSRITKPTTGTVQYRGRMASLLEVGTGFHRELTGRENIFLNGSILGMRRHEIARKLDEIVAFAEIDKFLDTPVKFYSSGMYVRLAFAVAAHLETDILIVDEVLAVGDAAFQKKCMGKMQEVSTQEGRTVLFVSHNMQAITTLTNKCAVLARGRVAFSGDTEPAINEYLRQITSSELIHTDKPSPTQPKVTRVEVRTSEVNNVQVNGEPMEVHIEITTPTPIRGACVSFQIINSMQQGFVHLWSFDSERPMCREAGVYHLVCRIPKTRLYLGNYTLTLFFSEPPGGHLFQKLEGICPFEVVMYGQHREFPWQPGTCAYLEECEWEVTKGSALKAEPAQQLAEK
jgi:lipopolysaccharide transport system ATP-binding protein